MKTVDLKVAFVVSDPIGDRMNIDIDSSEEAMTQAMIRAHLHALNTQPKYRRWFFSETIEA